MRIDHISIQVTDLPRSIDFYEKVFGLSILNEDTDNEIVRMGTTRILVSLHRKPPTGIVDHYAIAIEEFDRESVTQTLTQLGLTPEQNLDYGFYVRDPEGDPGSNRGDLNCGLTCHSLRVDPGGTLLGPKTSAVSPRESEQEG